ncbi:hypothetical protein HRR83_007125 [Exophiala dermatitidis]|uniref:Uncharacterized protein n=1 Tax=Exophiala dermatitidis TaxID=5970 RepID=A0AAN6ERJ6_EXODE|nr:hypothetical protein HRR73_006417 [Exophiala dermatitidis]KAJ4511979.1 hypothetical protein HRR74_006715 [Exophiala dermatitidis]KAJ4534843.1 hypothetical protein HRR76_006751 [Exophiala dermatitidis]KAJ4550808.1 hypothetical protein HRR77_003166 [Exophiala dermatitidis]KAJ4562067.1 hypothetical protein HRR79_006929 [Exophiala dermatitidis]
MRSDVLCQWYSLYIHDIHTNPQPILDEPIQGCVFDLRIAEEDNSAAAEPREHLLECPSEERRETTWRYKAVDQLKLALQSVSKKTWPDVGNWSGNGRSAGQGFVVSSSRLVLLIDACFTETVIYTGMVLEVHWLEQVEADRKPQ